MERLSRDSDSRFLLIEDNIKAIRENVANAAAKCGRSVDDISIMAVTKTVDPKYINHAIDCGITLIGENRVQEFLQKKDELHLNGVSAHLIGTLQSNKVRKIVGQVDMIQSVNSFKLAQEIDRVSAGLGIITKTLVEVNVGGESSKTGADLSQLDELLSQIDTLNSIRVEGLMTIPPICAEKSKFLKFFHDMNKLFIDIKAKKYDNSSMRILSMGMSSDYCEAICEGSTLIRPGRAIFGARL